MNRMCWGCIHEDEDREQFPCNDCRREKPDRYVDYW